jgi:hypothetical protein
MGMMQRSSSSTPPEAYPQVLEPHRHALPPNDLGRTIPMKAKDDGYTVSRQRPMATRALGTESIAHLESPASTMRCATTRPAGPPPTTARSTGGARWVVAGKVEGATAAPCGKLDRVPRVAAPSGPSSFWPGAAVPRGPSSSCTAVEIWIGKKKREKRIGKEENCGVGPGRVY